MNDDQKPPEGEIKPEDIASQIMVVRTKDNQIAVQYPVVAPDTPDISEALYLYAAGLNTLASMIRQQQQKMAEMLAQQKPPEKPRIAVVPAISKEFLVKEKL
jgi:hypothetical protein